jgi:hypothetical protein
LRRVAARENCMRAYRDWSPTVALMFAVAFAPSAQAAGVTQNRNVGPEHVQLHLLGAQPLFNPEDVAAKHITEGMEIVGGAAPVMPDAASHPNHSLIVQLLNRQTGQVMAHAKVIMQFGPNDDKGRPAGALVEVPVVVTQAIGKGPSSTSYGNNVTMPAGHYRVLVSINSEAPIRFTVTASDDPSMPMEHMNKM